MSIAAMSRDIEAQVGCLEGFAAREPLPAERQSRSVFCGSGDSLAAAMLAEAHSGLRIRAADPLDLLKNESVLNGRDLFLISISGRTVSNIRAASLARFSTAITASPNSRLAVVCQDAIPLQFPNSDGITAGTSSFLDSALCCISLARPVDIESPREIFEEAQRQAAEVSYSGRVFVLGNLHTYPLALYGAAKLYEVLGYGAAYQRLEQFSHMELFSTHPGDTVVIYEEPNRHSTALAERIKGAGLKVIQPKPPLSGDIPQFLFYAFFSQMVPLAMAEKRGLTRCHFLDSGTLLKTSNEMIY